VVNRLHLLEEGVSFFEQRIKLFWHEGILYLYRYN
jgi:hypothetical protein